MALLSLTHLARSDLEDIREFTTQTWGEAQWLRYYHGLAAKFDSIAETPGIGTPQFRFAEGMRSVRFEAHMVFYLEREEGVIVQRVLHVRRDMERVLGDE